ncbi:MAG: bifunctional indole-3-glycerol-phosphate synthase TrpC/phosphoribosylanthranilate isomerase TrpF [Gammaproteobacteria bacterium]|nr:bifunctional indole-3-glycerol-phosphate synthase TrpC/phosphoribosylanthranilate isomerase TrpF [Gammaproteobacteria bacterium]
MPSVLQAIVTRKRADVAARRAALPLSELLKSVQPTARSLAEGLAKPGTGFILECKKASPSEGVLRADYDPAAIARVYEPFAAGISVLCDGPYFQGGFEHLRAVRAAVDTPILCKDFVVEPYQVVEARYHGADAVLLMLSVLGDGEYRECAAAARDLGMDILTEVHDEAELDRAIALDAKIIGINNRDLKTLTIDLGTTARLAAKIPTGRLIVCESGIRSHGDVRAVADCVDGFLVGSHLMKAEALDLALRRLVFGCVKVCGLRDAASIRMTYAAGASYGGLIFAPGSPRRVDFEQAKLLAKQSPLPLVGVFVDAPLRQVAEYAEALDLAAVQLHGSESPDYVRVLRGLLATDREIWKALRIADERPDLSAYPVDRFLLDTYRPDAVGGTGACFDWSLLEGLKDKSRVILAGGLNPDNIRAAAALGVHALDVNSGVEAAPGVKDEQKLRRVFAALRGER